MNPQNCQNCNTEYDPIYIACPECGYVNCESPDNDYDLYGISSEEADEILCLLSQGEES